MKIVNKQNIHFSPYPVPERRHGLQLDFAGAANRSEAGSPERRVAERYRAAWQGVRARKCVRVETIAKDMIYVRLRGDRTLFERTGLSAAFEARDTPQHIQELAYVVIDGRRYSGKVVTDRDGALINPVQLSWEQALALARHGTGSFVCINGGFFNHKRMACEDAPENASIGKMVSDGLERPGLPLPQDYADDYRLLEFEDGSCIEVAPRLSESGKPVVTDETLADPKYDIERTDPAWRPDITPGRLQHAVSRHPRAAISQPASSGAGKTRLIVGTAWDRDNNPDAGYSLTQWAQIVSRLDKLSTPPNSSTNLDGGGSLALVAMTASGERICVAQKGGGRPVANLIAFVERPINAGG